jgi:adenosylcobinamide-GDP ribazoletransferase
VSGGVSGGGERRPGGWRVALSLFTVLPAGAGGDLGEGAAVRAAYWLPAVGLLLGAVSSGVMVLVAAGGPGYGRRLLGAVVAVGLLGALTGGLHLDGLADTADGLGSRRPAGEALDLMRRSDTGPLGVATLLLVLLVQVAALAALPRGWPGPAGLVLAAVTGRVSMLLATGTHAARPGGFGALVAGQTLLAGRVAAVAALLAMAAAGGFALGGAGGVARGLAGAAAGLAAGGALRRTARRRLGGMTGDVFGAVNELSTAAVLLALVLCY